MELHEFIFVALYFILIIISAFLVFALDDLSLMQKRFHFYICFLLPVWGILLRFILPKPIKGSHHYPNKRNKYSNENKSVSNQSYGSDIFN